ncbi:MAG: hypothetical protein J6S14_11655 [Clostridia bacterium]|nr:hypothetical protein [Clostridia bacterium]
MTKYFKVIPIDADEFIEAAGQDLDFCQLSVAENGIVYVAVDDSEEYEINIPLDFLDEEGEQT